MNTGAILNRINFGMAVAANRLPGAPITALPWTQSLVNATREQQVDTVVSHILGGAISPDMHKILLSGEHPFAKQAAQAATNAASAASRDTTVNSNTTKDNTANDNMADDNITADGTSMTAMQSQRQQRNSNSGNKTANKKGTRADNTRATRAARTGTFGLNGFGPPPQLAGLAQIIGLALGSPEFQRR
jgi:hypothetical protein